MSLGAHQLICVLDHGNYAGDEDLHEKGYNVMRNYKKKAITFFIGVTSLLVSFLVLKQKLGYVQNVAVKPPDLNDINTESLKETVQWSKDTKRRQRPRNDATHEKWIVVTSVSMPTDQVKKLSTIKGWKLVVVADLKTPENWKSVYMCTRIHS
jgi:hypothetical protein